MRTDPEKLPALLARYRQLHREGLENKRALAEVERQILGVAPQRRQRRPRNMHAIQATVDMLRQADAPLSREEVATRLGVLPKAASSRLARAMGMQLVERAGRGLYRCTEPGGE